MLLGYIIGFFFTFYSNTNHCAMIPPQLHLTQAIEHAMNYCSIEKWTPFRLSLIQLIIYSRNSCVLYGQRTILFTYLLWSVHELPRNLGVLNILLRATTVFELWMALTSQFIRTSTTNFWQITAIHLTSTLLPRHVYRTKISSKTLVSVET